MARASNLMIGTLALALIAGSFGAMSRRPEISPASSERRSG
jgi:hypothetical protein